MQRPGWDIGGDDDGKDFGNEIGELGILRPSFQGLRVFNYGNAHSNLNFRKTTLLIIGRVT